MSEDKYKNPWKTLNEKLVYETPWIKVFHDEVINPSGNEGIYGHVQFKNIALGIIPLDAEYNTWIVGQYRYPNKEYSWEIPEGGGPLGEKPLDAAKRELLEECGIKANNWKRICEMRLSNSVSDEIAYIYVAKELTFHEAQPDDTEELIVRKLPFEEVYQMVMEGEIKDSMSVAGILKLKLLIDKGEI